MFCCGTRASHCCGLSCCGAQAPDTQAHWPWLTGLAAPRHVGSSRTGARTRVPCIGRRTLNHCATREAPTGIFDHLLCTDAIQGPENTAVDETEESLLSWSYIPAEETDRKTRHNREITWHVRRGSASRRKDQVGQGKGKRGRRTGVRGLTEAARGKCI